MKYLWWIEYTSLVYKEIEEILELEVKYLDENLYMYRNDWLQHLCWIWLQVLKAIPIQFFFELLSNYWAIILGQPLRNHSKIVEGKQSSG